MLGLIGRKIGMSVITDGRGVLTPCTLVEAGPCVISHIKTQQKDGYDAVQLAWDERKEKRTPRPLLGHFKKAGVSPKKKLVEFRDFARDFSTSLSVGKEIKLEDVFTTDDRIKVSATSKGKGFQGVVKRHNFAGVGEATHGQHNRARSPGSIGGCSYPARVFKGMKMGGRMGGARVTVSGLRVLRLDAERGWVLLKGCVPGGKGGYVVLQKQFYR